MALYGNILILYGTNTGELTDVEQLLKNMSLPYMAKENTFYIGTEKKAQTRDLERQISKKAQTYVFHHIGMADGSLTKGKGIEETFVDGIEDIFHDFE